MKTLRASSGNTSSGATFWLMAAMRMKDRKGPGIMTVSAAGEEGGLAAVFGWSEESEEEVPWMALPEYAKEQVDKQKVDKQKKAAREKVKERRGHFIIGYLCEKA
jgi:hypothetical protein